MSLHSEEIARLSGELNLILSGALVNKARKGFQKEAIIEFYKDGEHYYLVIGLNPDLASIHLSPKNQCVFFDADRFTMALRKYLTRSVLNRISVIPGERVVFLEFSHGVKLAAHLFARGGNLFLVAEENRIVSSIHPVSEKTYEEPKPGVLDAGFTLKEPETTYNEQVSNQYQAQIQKNIRNQLVKTILSKTRKNIKALKEKLKKIQVDYQKCLKADDFFLYGSLILSYHSKNREKGLKMIESTDYEGKIIQIPLDPKKSVLENGEQYFEKSKKLKKALPILENRILEAEEQKEILESEQLDFEKMTLDELREYLREEKKVKLNKYLARSKLLIYENEKGFRLLVGRNSEENDAIFRLSRGKDYWFHNRDYPGSHILIWVENKAPDDETIKDAGMLAILYSKSKKRGEGFVMMSQRKFLNKLKGMPEGQVNVSRYKSIYCKVEADRMEKLKKLEK